MRKQERMIAETIVTRLKSRGIPTPLDKLPSGSELLSSSPSLRVEGRVEDGARNDSQEDG